MTGDAWALMRCTNMVGELVALVENADSMTIGVASEICHVVSSDSKRATRPWRLTKTLPVIDMGMPCMALATSDYEASGSVAGVHARGRMTC